MIKNNKNQTQVDKNSDINNKLSKDGNFHQTTAGWTTLKEDIDGTHKNDPNYYQGAASNVDITLDGLKVGANSVGVWHGDAINFKFSINNADLPANKLIKDNNILLGAVIATKAINQPTNSPKNSNYVPQFCNTWMFPNQANDKNPDPSFTIKPQDKDGNSLGEGELYLVPTTFVNGTAINKYIDINDKNSKSITGQVFNILYHVITCPTNKEHIEKNKISISFNDKFKYTGFDVNVYDYRPQKGISPINYDLVTPNNLYSLDYTAKPIYIPTNKQNVKSGLYFDSGEGIFGYNFNDIQNHFDNKKVGFVLKITSNDDKQLPGFNTLNNVSPQWCSSKIYLRDRDGKLLTISPNDNEFTGIGGWRINDNTYITLMNFGTKDKPTDYDKNATDAYTLWNDTNDNCISWTRTKDGAYLVCMKANPSTFVKYTKDKNNKKVLDTNDMDNDISQSISKGYLANIQDPNDVNAIISENQKLAKSHNYRPDWISLSFNIPFTHQFNGSFCARDVTPSNIGPQYVITNHELIGGPYDANIKGIKGEPVKYTSVVYVDDDNKGQEIPNDPGNSDIIWQNNDVKTPTPYTPVNPDVTKYILDPKNQKGDLEYYTWDGKQFSYTFQDNQTDGTNRIIVHLTHLKTQIPNAKKTITETIHYIYKDNDQQAAPDNTQTVTFTRSGEKDAVTGQTSWGNWSSINPTFAAVISPIIKGYTADQLSIAAQTVKYDSSNIVKTVTYTAKSGPKTSPTQPTGAPTKPIQPTGVPTTPTQPTTAPTKPTQPTNGPTEPTQPSLPKTPTTPKPATSPVHHHKKPTPKPTPNPSPAPKAGIPNSNVIPHGQNNPSGQNQNVMPHGENNPNGQNVMPHGESTVANSNIAPKPGTVGSNVAPNGQPLPQGTKIGPKGTIVNAAGQVVGYIDKDGKAHLTLPQTGENQDSILAAAMLGATIATVGLLGLTGTRKKRKN